jgi:hypothetical protein
MAPPMTDEKIRSVLVKWCLGSENIHTYLASHGLAIVPKETTECPSIPSPLLKAENRR